MAICALKKVGCDPLLNQDVRSIRSHSSVQRERWKLPTSSKFFYEGSNAFQFIYFFILKIKNRNKIISWSKNLESYRIMTWVYRYIQFLLKSYVTTLPHVTHIILTSDEFCSHHVGGLGVPGGLRRLNNASLILNFRSSCGPMMCRWLTLRFSDIHWNDPLSAKNGLLVKRRARLQLHAGLKPWSVSSKPKSQD